MRKVLLFMSFWVVMLIAATFLASCGKTQEQTDDEADNESHSSRRTPKDEPDVMTVDYRTSKCSTGRHVFTSKTAYCNGLLDNELMNKCARAWRVNVYRLRCNTYKH